MDTDTTQMERRVLEGAAEKEEQRDLGFGRVLSSQAALRLLNRDGSFNVYRRKAGLFRRIFTYHGLLTMPWSSFFAIVIGTYLVLNAVFAFAYVLCGPGALQGKSVQSPFWDAFFFSVHTFATIGYGDVVPVGFPANLLVTAESVVGLLSFALATGLLFARFARPTAQIIYSRQAIIAPYRGITAFEFRVINARDNQIINLEARVILTRFEESGGLRQRRYYLLPLERQNVAFFPLAWTVVHPIDQSSPLYGWNRQTLLQSHAEFLILLTGVDETFAQSVHSRSSYSAEEVVWGARFASLFQDGEAVPTLDMTKFHQVEPVEEGAMPAEVAFS